MGHQADQAVAVPSGGTAAAPEQAAKEMLAAAVFRDLERVQVVAAGQAQVAVRAQDSQTGMEALACNQASMALPLIMQAAAVVDPMEP
jgi:hypothetical protein